METVDERIARVEQEIQEKQEELKVLRNLKPHERLLMTPLSEFEFTRRTLNALKHCKKETVFDLCVSSKDDILNIRGIGFSGYDEIVDFLRSHSLALL